MVNKNQKLLLCYHSAEFGGVEKQILDIVKGLSSEIDITVACPLGSLVDDYKKHGAKHVELFPRSAFDIKYAFAIAKLVKKHKYSIVHGHELKAGGLSIFGAFLGGSAKRIYHVHTPFIEWRYHFLKKIPAIFVNTIVNFVVGNFFATDVLALTNSIKKVRVYKEFICPLKIRVIPNGLDIKKLKFTQKGRDVFRQKHSIDQDTIVFGLISRVSAEKGHSDLLRGYAKYIKLANQQSKLLIAGGGNLLNDIKRLAKNLGISDNVVFTGKFGNTQLLNLYSATDTFVFPTHTEGFGYVAVEAMAMGIPVIANDIPVLHDIGEGVIQFVDTKVPAKLANTMINLGNDKQLRKKLGSLGVDHARKYDMTTFIANYRKLYTAPETKNCNILCWLKGKGR